MNAVNKDVVCGMTVLARKGPTVFHKGETMYFCSDYCMKKFLEQPNQYLATLVNPNYDEAQGNRRIAYFSMEVALGESMPTYSGGLGVLAGDTLKSCADLRVPIVGVSLIYRKGYFDQRLGERGEQQELPVQWEPERFLRPLREVVHVEIEKRVVRL